MGKSFEEIIETGEEELEYLPTLIPAFYYKHFVNYYG